MRTIKFRGQRLDNGGWVYGCIGYGFNQSIQYIMPKMYFATRDFGEVDENGEMIIEDEIAIGGFIPVNPETVGQFIGIDTKGKEVYDGDYMRYKRRNGQWCKCTVVYENAGFSFENKTEQATYHAAIFMNKGKIYAEKIGNKFDSKPLTVNKFRHNEDF